ncbi:3-oxoacyl-ACP reductase FabG [Salegentibacter mishustinae]|uniref:3-ketoacyl-ACP reductase n=1 Tax=Salegentibacter mishustinae TaxID=270918 RepID=A0A0Q9Z322_9FLAO|nr:3-oxoacyl-ACP reductase FabG [Salegentibacter mishustinae]KRG27222.1 3-ketoacyl-ACP reductase [Salegentibacter mishustinae]PNW21456.1 3-ketoacyl-ACP reductase [Salegentibacter mishustinae]PZX62595.1 3-oxoacyl-[acyl-carrier protein] reductase [Salegentibacter mishustinae]GGW96953.1 3-ketoacyl-ACP reductase [Salegentibacter mishustinae]
MKYALITGASRGIGKAIAVKLAKELQYNILLNFHSNIDAANATKELVEAENVHCELLQFDVSDTKMSENVLQDFRKNNPDAEIEIIVNNAGITRDGLFMWMKPEDWHSVINTSLNGFYNVTQPLLKDMLKRRYGRIINIVSLSGLKGNAGQVNYSAAKGALISATKALAKEIGKRKVTVNAVAPGFITSDMTADFDEKELKKMIPLNRFGEAEEVADLVSFLASKKASYITGEVININGGLYS